MVIVVQRRKCVYEQKMSVFSAAHIFVRQIKHRDECREATKLPARALGEHSTWRLCLTSKLASFFITFFTLFRDSPEYFGKTFFLFILHDVEKTNVI